MFQAWWLALPTTYFKFQIRLLISRPLSALFLPVGMDCLMSQKVGGCFATQLLRDHVQGPCNHRNNWPRFWSRPLYRHCGALAVPPLPPLPLLLEER